MNTLEAYVMGEMDKEIEMMVFDWDKAAKRIAEEHPESASAGLINEWEWTSGEIYRDGNPETYELTYLASIWATPGLEMDGKIEPCYRMKSETPGWNSRTKWPESALKILKAHKVIDAGDK